MVILPCLPREEERRNQMKSKEQRGKDFINEMTPRGFKPTSQPRQELTLNRKRLEVAMANWAYHFEGPIAGEFITGLIGEGRLIEALKRVAASMEQLNASFELDDVMIVYTAWTNFNSYGSPGFALTGGAKTLRNIMRQRPA